MDTLLADVEAFLAAHHIPPSRFGAEALGDKHFVRQLRAGRDPKLSTAERVRSFMARHSREAEAA